MDLTRGRLAELALGKERANRVDYAIPQPVFNGMSQAQRDDVAGWYYEPEKANVFGRLLTQSECWIAIRRHLLEGRLHATLGAATEYDIGYAIAEWPCLPYHAERREVQIFTPAEWQQREAERAEFKARRMSEQTAMLHTVQSYVRTMVEAGCIARADWMDKLDRLLLVAAA